MLLFQCVLIISVYFFTDLEHLPSFEKQFPPMLIFNKPNSIWFEKGCKKWGVIMSWILHVSWTVHNVCHIIPLLLKASNLVKEWKVITRYKIMPLCPSVEIYPGAQWKAMTLTHCPFIGRSSCIVKTVVLGHCSLPYNPLPMPFHFNI